MRKTRAELEADLTRIAADYGPCDVVVADIDAGTRDDHIRAVLEICARLSGR